MKKTAGYRLRDLKRRSGYDANILPAKRPALSVADRVAKKTEDLTEAFPKSAMLSLMNSVS